MHSKPKFIDHGMKIIFMNDCSCFRLTHKSTEEDIFVLLSQPQLFLDEGLLHCLPFPRLTLMAKPSVVRATGSGSRSPQTLEEHEEEELHPVDDLMML